MNNSKQNSQLVWHGTSEETDYTRKAISNTVKAELARPYALQTPDVNRMFDMPLTMGLGNRKPTLAKDSADPLIPMRSMFNQSLLGHLDELGQVPYTAFPGYAALQLFAQNGMIRACVKTVADEMTREFIELEGGEATGNEEDDSAANDRLDDLKEKIENKYHLRKLFNDAFSMIGFFGGALIYIDTGKTNSPEELKAPLILNGNSAEFQKGSHLKFVLVNPVNVTAAEVNVNNPLASDYMKPRSWFIQGVEVHSSRLIVMLDNEPPELLKPAYNFLGIPQSQILWDYVAHWNKARVEGVELLTKLNTFVFKTDMASILSSIDGVEQLDAHMRRLARYRDSNSVLVIDKEAEDAVNVSQTITGARELITQALEFVAAINGTPAVKLLGQSPSGFNATGESDIRNYYDHIEAKQELHRDAIQRVLNAIQLVEYGAIDESVKFRFADLGVEDEAAQAMTAKTTVDSLAVLLDRNVISPEEVRQAVKSNADLPLTNIADDAPEAVEGDLMTNDPSEGNAAMQAFLDKRDQDKQQQVNAANTASQLQAIQSKIQDLEGANGG